MNALTSEIHDKETPGYPGVSFGRSADGLLVALVGETAFAMAPGRDGKSYLAAGWRISRPMAEWTRNDFYGHSGELADEDAFRAKILENAHHQQQRAALGRREIHSRANTPWGISQRATVYAEGVTVHSTASHGGFHLTGGRNSKVHGLLRSVGGWYEEDCHWAAVAQAFPDLFTDFEKACAEKTIRDWYPDAWEAIHGRVLEPGQSSMKDEREFHKRHADGWIVVSAIRSDHEAGFTEVVATLGGDRAGARCARRFLVPSSEYGVSGGRFGFVIDEVRHREYDGPSTFVGWNR
ncbi:DUF7007 domain-containing protein [Mesorhizobium sp. L-2-11]|uniref:DUF7007 domain-containing protein n=1 Tax=Mesorhizobium sp. L-2-11 TaxID=2744521 RepID=UPI001926E5C0|nr:hypothetical protein [Mesorhizobium sp. L-2-11]BCH19553.1 hypothetical protein MesoLjLa_64040 [Mesorhizobium sp. L-2-11]